MKISLAWIFEYISADYRQIDVPKLVTQFNQTTAEIEQYYQVRCDVQVLSIARVLTSTSKNVTLYSDEWNKQITLPPRLVQTDQYYLVIKEDEQVRWALSTDLGAHKQMSLPSIYVQDQDRNGGWKKTFETTDWILEIDNKSITNRPDLWGHYGMAREIAAILDLPLIPLDDLLAKKDVEKGDTRISGDGFTIINKAPQACVRFAGLYFEYIEHRSSLLWMVSRLSRIDSRAIDAIVDITNYVMLDISQPLHAFDAEKLPDRTITVRMADNKEKLVLLDDQEITLTSNDLVISDGRKPIALAGIMGGASTAVSSATNTIFLEAACFNAAVIRKTSMQFGVRTDASARFEKSLDPNQNILGIRRFLKLVYDCMLDVKDVNSILSLGAHVKEQEVKVQHSFIEKRLGTSVSSDFVVTTLRKLGFTIEKDGGSYTIWVPTYRGSKDIALKEDIVEEVGRFFGYDNIPYKYPTRQMCPFSLTNVMRTRAIKELMAYGLHMHEVQPYAFFDQSFLHEIGWSPTDVLAVKNPISGNWKQLVTSLVPNLFKVIADHKADYEHLRFFEWGRVWSKGVEVSEQKSLSAIVYERKDELTFYTGRALLENIFAMLQMQIEWISADKTELEPWFLSEQTAFLEHNGTRIGIIGMANPAFFEKIAAGSACIFELNGDYLLSYKIPPVEYRAPIKFPGVPRDLSLLVPNKVTVDQVSSLITQVDDRIGSVVLADYFEKKEWADKKSVTMGFVITDPTKTLTKEEIDALVTKIINQLKKIGATVR